MTIHRTQEVTAVLADLHELLAAQDTSRRVADVASQRIDSIARSLQYLEQRDYRIAFVGQIGIGKSSMIGVLGNLLVGDVPRDRPSLKSNSVLAVGSGGTTVCEVRIRTATPEEHRHIKLSIDPFSVEEMSREIRIFAADEWSRRKGPPAKADDDKDPTAREVQRVIRNMTGLSERVEVDSDNKRKAVDPLDDAIRQHDSAGSLANYLVDKAALLSRTDTDWFWPNGDDAHRELKRRFDDINHGRTPTAMLPKRITITVPRPLPDLSDEFDVEVIDTRGFDGQLSGRRDIQNVLRDERALIVVCVPFRDAPGEAVKNLLRDIAANAELATSASRIHLVLMDHGDADGVNGSEGDREFGQSLKLNECSRALQAIGLENYVRENTITAFDTLKDAPHGLLHVLQNRLHAMRSEIESRLGQQVLDARAFLDNLEDVKLELARAEVDRRLQVALRAHRPNGAPMRDPLQGLYSAINSWRYASQVYAACRRSGRHRGFDAFATVRTGASEAATSWLRGLNAALTADFKALVHDEEFSEILSHVRLREMSYTEAYVTVIRDFSDSVLAEIEMDLEDSDVWTDCASEWGGGTGFKQRVIEHLEKWSRTQAFHAHCDFEPLLNALVKAVGGSEV